MANLKIDVSALEQKIIAERGASVTPTKGVLERAKSDGDAKLIDEKNGASKSFKYSQRSLRRGSGAGSPNSLLTIPRCPAFDFSEQEDVHSIFPPLSEPESYSSFKTESYQGVHKSDNAADKEYSQNTLRLKDTSQKKRDTSKSKSLMPEFMENSETESTKGSFECEALELPSNTEAPSIPDIAFPSLPNTFLAKLGVHKDSPLPVEAFDEQDLESKFIALSLAFKTDRSTLNKRLELHKRQRDMAEKNVENEFQSMRDHLSALNLKATNSDIRDLISKIQNHLDIAQQATSRVSGRSETYGAVQQEERVSRAFEVLVLHVDHLKRLFDKEHKELEETKRMLTDTRVFKKDFTADIVTEDQKKYSKTFGLPVSSIKSVGRRRASVADFHPRSFLENCKSPEFSQSWTSGLSVQRVEPKQPRNSYPMTSTTVGLISNSLPTSSIASKPPARKPSTTGISSRRCSLPAANPIMAPKTSPEAVSNEPTPPAVPFPSKLFNSKKDRNVWTRKLSSVTDEKEQSEEEVDLPKLENKTENGNISEINMEHFMLRAFLQEVEMKNSELYETFDNQFDDYENLSDHVESSEKKWYKITFKIVLQFILNSTVGKYLKNPRIQEVWHQNSTLTLIRYFCSGVLVFVAFCCLCSLILPCLGMNFDFIQGMCATVFSIIIFH